MTTRFLKKIGQKTPCNTLLQFVTSALVLRFSGKFRLQKHIKCTWAGTDTPKIYHFCHFVRLFLNKKFSIFPCYIVTIVTKWNFEKLKGLSVLRFSDFCPCNKPP